jgi:hypothetical protein
MANTLYDKGRELFLGAQINWATATIRCCLVDTAAGKYSFSAAHQFFNSVNQNGSVIAPATGGGIQLVWSGSGSPNLPIVGGAADADDVTFSTVSGNSIEAIVIYQDKGTGDAASPLIAYIDTATGLPITPNGGDIIVTWDNGANKIFRL